MTIEFSGTIWYWRGPAPFHFVSLPVGHAREVKEIASAVTYGWGVIPVRARIGQTEWTTSLFPKNGTYALPIKDAVRKAENLDLGAEVDACLEVIKSG
jgi:hypothetical protein